MLSDLHNMETNMYTIYFISHITFSHKEAFQNCTEKNEGGLT